MEDRSAELDEREIDRSRARGAARRLGRFSRAVALGFILPALFFPPAGRAEERKSVTGKLVLKGKSLALTHAWLVRGPDTFDRSKAAAYVVLASKDISEAILACGDIHCVVWDVVQEGAVLEPSGDGHESFWLRVVSSELEKEQQLSGRRFTPTIDRHDRLSGRLEFSYPTTGDEADLQIDAPLAKEFPVSPR